MMRLNKKQKGKAKVIHKETFTLATIEGEKGRKREGERKIYR